MSKTVKTIEPVRVSADQIRAAIAAYPLTSTGGTNIFGGRAGASRAQIWDYALVCTPGAYWTSEDMLALHVGIWKRGVVCQGKGAPIACADATTLRHTCYNPLHTSEHTGTADVKKCWQDKTGARQAHVASVNGGWQLNPAWVAHLTAAGSRIEAGYPSLPLAIKSKAPKTTAPKTVKSKAPKTAAPAAAPEASATPEA